MNGSHENSWVRIAAPFLWSLPYFFSFLGLLVYEIDLQNLLRVYNLLLFPIVYGVLWYFCWILKACVIISECALEWPW